MIKTIKGWIEAITKYDQAIDDVLDLKTDLSMIKLNQDTLHKALDECKASLPKKPSVNDADYWNNKWVRKNVYYSAPRRKLVKDYLKYREIEEISKFAYEQILSSSTDLIISKDYDSVPLSVLEWLESKFKSKEFVYKLDIGEKWNNPEETLKLKVGDCDDFAILSYFIIRETFKHLGVWDKVKHRLKLQALNVNRYGIIPSTVGGHANLLWLHSDGNWYTIESTYFRPRSILNYGKKPQKLNPAYGNIWFTANEDHMWAQHSLTVTKEDFKKNEN